MPPPRPPPPSNLNSPLRHLRTVLSEDGEEEISGRGAAALFCYSAPKTNILHPVLFYASCKFPVSGHGHGSTSSSARSSYSFTVSSTSDEDTTNNYKITTIDHLLFLFHPTPSSKLRFPLFCGGRGFTGLAGEADANADAGWCEGTGKEERLMGTVD